MIDQNAGYVKFVYRQAWNDLCLGLVNRNGPRRVLSY